MIIEQRTLVVTDDPTGSEHVEGLGEHVIVNRAGVNRKQPHEEYDISSGEEYVPNFIVGFLHRQLLFEYNQVEAEQEHDQTVAAVTEHDSEKEWECNYRV